MLLLAIDTAGVACSVAILDTETDEIVSSLSENLGRGHAERLMAMIDEVLAARQVELKQIGRIAVGIGPGSFTGIRVGVAAARGFALALNIPVVGVTTLSVLAEMAPARVADQKLAVVIDAKRDEVFCQSFDASGEPLDDPHVLSVDDLKSVAYDPSVQLFGSGAELIKPSDEATVPDHYSIEALARLGAKASPVSDKASPLYLRGPDAKPQVGFAVSRK